MADNELPFVRTATYYSVDEAELARAHLEGNGIVARIEGQHAIGVLPLEAIALGGVRVLVRADDLERAQELLATTSAGNPTNGKAAEPIAVDEGDAWMKRASFSAFLGVSACPLVGTVYASYLIARYGSLPRGPSGRLHYRLAVVFIFIALGVMLLWQWRRH
jgi:hypothetical protein